MVYCNKCNHEFNITVRTKCVKDDVKEVFFNCPNCHERYTAYYLNNKIKKMQKQLRGLKTSTLKNNYMQQIAKEMNRLKEIYSAS